MAVAGVVLCCCVWRVAARVRKESMSIGLLGPLSHIVGHADYEMY